MNRLALKLRFCAAFLLLGLWGADAQTAREQIAAVPERAGGIYHSYEYRPAAAAPAPDGYTPFYISHYGRHGSRWHASESVYAGPLKILRKAAEAGALTPLGRDVLGRVEIIAADADKRYGDLSPRGVAEHRGIAERMYKAYPEVFSTADGRECRIESRSTLVPRCILSMAAFNERLKELNPAIRTTRESSARYMPYMGNNKGLDAQRDRTLKTADSVRAARLIPDRLMKSLFSDPEFVKREVKKPRKLMEQLLLQAAIMQDVDYLGISLYDLFTGEEIYAAWEDENFRRYVMFGPSKRFGDPIIADAKPCCATSSRPPKR
ncbi:MAG: histidine-type phosphatase [Alistipes finegoldii]|uniref:histidine-type phosphatase n=1 Tax=Alistipes finegoldii TaxID=214856 RepID=UPI00399523D3